MATLFSPNLDKPLPLPKIDSWPESKHLFDEATCWAVRAALAAERPLLIRGEPGIGKSQLARAVAVHYGVPFLYHVVDERTERDDLLHRYDAVSRLGQAQLLSITFAEKEKNWEEEMAERRFVMPEVLWWAFDWKGAEGQANSFFRKCSRPKLGDWCEAAPHEDPRTGDERPPCSSVVLIDEIDKADPAVPNGLLECLGNRGFQTAQLGESVALPDDMAPPFVVITTNEERELPAAFLRRCLVLNLTFPPKDLTVSQFLVRRARVFHEPDAISDAVLEEIVRLLRSDRADARHGHTRPGAAEFLDIVRALVSLHPGDEEAQKAALGEIGGFALKKAYVEPSS